MPTALEPLPRQPEARPRYEVADIFRRYGKHYRCHHPLPAVHRKVMHDIEVCRTAYLGGHLEQCNCCGYRRYSYNSCRNRHCPKCQSLTKANWLEARKAELLPVAYFHNVFTLPHELNSLALCNKRVVCNLLFQAVAQTLLQFGANPENGLGGKLGFTCILHTWDQTLRDHFHLHCLVAGGALSFHNDRWIGARDDFLFPIKALSRVFRGKFIALLRQAFATGQLVFPGATQHLQSQHGFSQLIDQLCEKDWVVYSKRPLPGPQPVLDYLGRYTHRVAIANHRIIDIDNDRIVFRHKDRNNNDAPKLMTLSAEEFIRRFLLHVLPDGFMRIRHFGFLANRVKKHSLGLCRKLLGLSPQLPRPKPKTARQLLFELTGTDPNKCPQCRHGTMLVIAELPALSHQPFNPWYSLPQIQDSS